MGAGKLRDSGGHRKAREWGSAAALSGAATGTSLDGDVSVLSSISNEVKYDPLELGSFILATDLLHHDAYQHYVDAEICNLRL
eukprot:g39375.t1